MLVPERSFRRGAVLIIVLGVLAVLSLLATTFATLQATERQIARNYLDTVRAKLLAQSGVEAAVARLTELASSGEPGHISIQYWGNNLTETGAPDWAVPLEEAMNPSLAWKDEPVQDPFDANVRPLLLTLDGRPVGFSGRLATSAYARNGDLYRLRVADCNSMIFVNDGLENGNGGYVSLNLNRILNNLGDVIGVRGAGDRILSRRPKIGYIAKSDLETVLGSADFARIRPFVTTFAWVDKNVSNPVPLSSETLSSYPVRYGEKLGVYRYGRSFGSSGQPIRTPLVFAPDHAAPTGFDHAIMALDEVNAQWIEVCRRAPVNVNLAPKEVLTALLVGLQGFFVVERRKQNPTGDMYSILFHHLYDNVPGDRLGDEYGFLYATVPFVGPGKTVAGGVSAPQVADEIIACRSRQRSPACPGVDYGKLWYGGPFSTWRQFNAFCDGLVAGGLLRDDRPIYFDYLSQPGFSAQFNGPDNLVSSALQSRFAAQALADLLKANFNPNLTLNEANPDRNLYTIVDKTDLISNSTEFCFTPMGLFEIESEGLVVRTPGDQDLMAVRQGTIWAREKIVSVAKVFDVYRESSQSEFHGSGQDSKSSSAPGSLGLVLGPEPDVSPLPQECCWGGWLQLPAARGPGGKSQGPALGETLVGRYSTGFNLLHHAGGMGAARPLRPRGGEFRNNPDRTESVPGPYGPGVGAPGQYRIARAWTEARPPSLPKAVAASDLRMDGAYVERDSALMYANDASVLGLKGTVSYWIKPSFHPEMTGKPRTYFSVDRILPLVYKGQATGNTGSPFFLILAQWFFPSHDAPPGFPSPNEGQAPTYSDGPWRPIMFMAGYSTWGGIGGGVGVESGSLNHTTHPDSSKTSVFRDHSWIHVAFQWDMVQHATRLAINGKVVGTPSGDIMVHPEKNNDVSDYLPAPIRFGEPSLVPVDDHHRGRNWAADATIDEIHMWKGDMLSAAQLLYSHGRYQVPGRGSEASFTSQAIRLDSGPHRSLPPPCRVGGPAGGAPPSTTVTQESPPIRILYTAWTWYPEFVSEKGIPMIRDYRSQTDFSPGRDLEVETEMRLVVNGAPGEAFKLDGGTGVTNVTLNSSDRLNYRMSVRIPKADLDTVLLATPVIDDVTIYFTTGVQYQSYYVERVAR